MVTQEKTGKSPCDTSKKTTVERDDLYLAARRFSISYFTLGKKRAGQRHSDLSLSCGRIDDFLIYLQIFHTNDLNQHAQYHEHLITLLDRSPA